MKIALYVHCFFPQHYFGTEAYTLTLAKELKALGHSPTVVSATFQGEPRQDRFIHEYEWEGIPVIAIDKNVVPHSTVEETYDQPILRWVHERILRRIQPDVVHVCHLINHTIAVLEASRALGLPVFATLTDFFGFCLTNKLETADGSLCAGPSASRSNCIQCHLKAAGKTGGRLSRLLGGSSLVRAPASRLLALAGRVRPRTRVQSLRPADITTRPDRLRSALATYREAIAPSGFLLDAYRANGFPSPLRSSHFGLEIDRRAKPPSSTPDKVRLGYVGQIEPHKGVDILLKAMREAGRSNLSLAIWGDETQNAAHAAELRRLSEGLDVQFSGTFGRDRIAEVFAGIDMLVIPSTWYENSPLILLQALATHTPVIVSDVAGLTEFMTEGISGFAFPRGSVGGLAQLLRQVGDDPAIAARMSATTHYERSLQDMARDVLTMYADHGLAA